MQHLGLARAHTTAGEPSARDLTVRLVPCGFLSFRVVTRQVYFVL